MKFKLSTLVTSLISANVAFAATPVDLHHQQASYLQHAFLLQSAAAPKIKFEKTRTDVDLNQTTHTRIQQTYNGIPVWNATAVIHTPKPATATKGKLSAFMNNSSTMNGVVFEGIEKDLAATPSFAFTEEQKAKALQQAKAIYEKKSHLNNVKYTKEQVKPIIFIDTNHQAHHAYLLSFYHDDGRTGAHRPTFIMDATTLQSYRHWDQVMTVNSHIIGGPEPMAAGGIGGNGKIGERIYDGDKGHMPALPMTAYKTDIEVFPGQKLTFFECVFDTNEIVVQDVSYDNAPVSSLCLALPNQHNNASWISFDNRGTRWKHDEMNGGYSPAFDAFYGATIVKKLYQDWYNTPVLVQEDGKTPMKLVMRVHYGRNFENAFWDGEQMTFGDGAKMFYPLTSLDIAAHEISHGFTMQHSNINGEITVMGALHEAFSDMAAAAAEYYVSGKNTWAMGVDVMKGDGALRYMNEPTKDTNSIDHVRDFEDEMDPHLAAGIFNKAFYLIATSKGWNTHKAFDVMVKANMNYWNPSMTKFNEVACGVVSATKDLAQQDPSYTLADVRIAFTKVGIETSDC